MDYLSLIKYYHSIRDIYNLSPVVNYRNIKLHCIRCITFWGFIHHYDPDYCKYKIYAEEVC